MANQSRMIYLGAETALPWYSWRRSSSCLTGGTNHDHFHFQDSYPIMSKINAESFSFKGRCPKKNVFLGLCPKHQTPPTHSARLGLHSKWKIKVQFILLIRLFRAFHFFEKMRNFLDKVPCICLGLWTPIHPPPPLF